MVNLKAIRKAAGISQNRLARMCGVVRQTIGEIETERNKPSVMLAKQLGVIFNIDWTLFFEDIKPTVIDINDGEHINRCLNCCNEICTNCIG